MGMLKQIDARTLGLADVAIDRIPGGKIAPRTIDRLAESENVEIALEQLDRTEFAPSIERGILAYGQTDRLSVLERFFEALVLEKGVKMFRTNPLGIAVPIGFIWRKINEFINLRALIRGKRYGLQAGTIREELVLV
jgi:vacuolar-type H+-ATPase subunit C/Vma6